MLTAVEKIAIGFMFLV